MWSLGMKEEGQYLKFIVMNRLHCLDCPFRVSTDENCVSFTTKTSMHLKNKGKGDGKTHYKYSIIKTFLN